MSGTLNTESRKWVLKDYRTHTCNMSTSTSTRETGTEGYSKSGLSVTQQMIAPALVSACIQNEFLKPKDANIILHDYVKRYLPQQFLSETLKIAKSIAFSGKSKPEFFLAW